MEKLITDLELLFQDTLEDSTIKLTRETTANEVKDWDSVNHLLLLHTIEQHFKIKFSLDEMIHFQNVGDICDSILFKTSN
jgi:acyl carrier protein